MSERLPPIDDALMDEAQTAAKAGVLSGARGVFQGPFVPLLRSPGLMTRLEKVGAYLRYESKLPGRIREFAILITARAFTQHVEWAIHYPIALREGVSPSVLTAIAAGRRPDEMSKDEDAAYEFLAELRLHQAVGDVGYERAIGCFGEAGVIDLIAIAGYYGLLAMVMNVARTPAPDGDAPRLPHLR